MRLILLAAVGAALAACTTPGGPSPAAGRTLAEFEPSGQPYGPFLAGNAALNAGKAREAERLFARAAAAAPLNTTIKARAFAAALASGDIPKAAALAPDLEADPSAGGLGVLVRAVDALASDRPKDAHTLLNGPELPSPHSLAAALVRPWAAVAAGQPAPSGPQAVDGPIADVLAEVGGLELLERSGRHAEADAQLAALDPAAASTSTVLSHGAYLERRRRAPEAAALYQRALDVRPDSASLQEALRRARTGRKAPPAPSIREGAAEALLVPAVVLAGARQTEAALAYLRLSLHLDPRRDDAWVALGELLAGAGDLDGARRAFLKPQPGSDQYASSRARLSLALEDAGRGAEALDTARAAASASQDPAVHEAYAALLVERRRFDEAAAVFDRLLATPDGARNWRLWYLRGAAHERAGRWPQSERDMLKALELAPEEPEVLNYLGYSWVDRGERLQQAMGMIEKAAQLRPRSGAIVDSLGWAHFRLGNFSEAVERLERAAELDPGDPTINDHLGDAYWRTGRRIEAQFQWRRVLSLEPEPKLKTEVETKLASPQGLDGLTRSVASAP